MERKIVTTYTYDGDSKNAVKMESTDGQWFERKYDERGNEIYYKDYSGLSKTSTYNDQNQIIAESDSKGNTVSYKYDNLGRCVEVEYKFVTPSIIQVPGARL